MESNFSSQLLTITSWHPIYKLNNDFIWVTITRSQESQEERVGNTCNAKGYHTPAIKKKQ